MKPFRRNSISSGTYFSKFVIVVSTQQLLFKYYQSFNVRQPMAILMITSRGLYHCWWNTCRNMMNRYLHSGRGNWWNLNNMNTYASLYLIRFIFVWRILQDRNFYFDPLSNSISPYLNWECTIFVKFQAEADK
jgi:hypothetical protein